MKLFASRAAERELINRNELDHFLRLSARVLPGISFMSMFNKIFHSGSSSHGSGGGDSSSNNMGSSVKDLQHSLEARNSELKKKADELKIKDSRIAVLEQELKKKDDVIEKLTRELDKYRSVLQPAATVVSHKTRARNLGISAEPSQSLKAVQQAQQPLKRHTKSSK